MASLLVAIGGSGNWSLDYLELGRWCSRVAILGREQIGRVVEKFGGAHTRRQRRVIAHVIGKKRKKLNWERHGQHKPNRVSKVTLLTPSN